MSFSILVSKKLLYIHEFLRFLPCGSCERKVLLPENNKTLIIHVSRNVLFFPNRDFFASFFAFFVGNKLKNTQNIPLWLCYCISSYWLIFICFSVFLRKTPKRHVFSNFFSIPKKFCQNFGILVPIKKNKKKKILIHLHRYQEAKIWAKFRKLCEIRTL